MNDKVPPKLYEVLQKVVKGNIDNFVIRIHDPNKKGEGYLGEIIFLSLLDKTSGKQLNLVVKQAFSNANIRRDSPIREVFLNEIYFYTKIWPRFINFQETIPSEIRFHHVAKCLLTVSEEDNEKLVFENLKYQGYEMHDKKQPVEKEKMESIFKIYGRLHAISFAYKSLYPEEFEQLTSGILDVWSNFFQKEHFELSIKLTQESCIESLQPGRDDAIIDKYKTYIEDGVEKFHKSYLKGKYNAIIHGDCWSNNMMFKYDGLGKVTDVRLLDFQLFNVGSPVCDLSYCLYSGGTKEMYDDLDYLLEVYYKSFSENIKAFGFIPEELFSLDNLKDDWKEYCILGFTMGCMILRGKLTDDDEIMDLTDITDNLNEDLKKFYDTKYDEDTYKLRTREIILHLYERNYM